MTITFPDGTTAEVAHDMNRDLFVPLDQWIAVALRRCHGRGHMPAATLAHAIHEYATLTGDGAPYMLCPANQALLERVAALRPGVVVGVAS
jgi:hypothetical protein